MKVIQFRQALHDLPDDAEVMFLTNDGEPIPLEAAIFLKKDNTLVFGEDDEGLKEALEEYNLDTTDDDEEPTESCAEEGTGALGATCSIEPPHKPEPSVNPDYELL